MRLKRLSLSQRRGLMGVVFLTPWLIGFIFLFALPMFDSLRFSLSHIEITQNGISTAFHGLKNYKIALLEDGMFNRTLAESIISMFINVPLILFFSLFSASLLNQKFRGRTFARAIFFLPVILASGVIMTLNNASFMQQVMSSATAGDGLEVGAGVLKSFELQRLLLESGLNEKIVGYLSGAVNRIYDIVSASGVQILIFLAGLQSISPTLFEASKMEGATSYESFWKITFPMVSPLIVTNLIYTIIDSFARDQTTNYIHVTAFKTLDFGLSSAMAWVYFMAVAIILGLSTWLISKKVFYYD